MNLANILTASKQLQGEPSLTGTDGTSAGALLDSALNLWGKGVDVYTSLTASPGVAPSGQVTAPTTTTAAASTWKQYLPWILGGGAALVVVYFVLRKR